MLSQNPYFGFQKDRGHTHRLWEKFNSGLLDIEALQDPYERLLVSEWTRCSEFGIDVHMSRGRMLDMNEFDRIVSENEDFLATASQVISRVNECLVNVPGILILTDATGTIMQIVGDEATKRLADEESGIVEGSRWLEEVAGTNGLGSAIRRRAPVHVFASEHFCEGWHHWTCAATPIIGPEDDVVGVIDFTTMEKDYRDSAVGLTYSLARAIQADLRLEHELELSALYHSFTDLAGRYPGNDLVVFNRRGRPIRHTADEAVGRLLEAFREGNRARGSLSDKHDLYMPGSGKLIGSAYVLAKRSPIKIVPETKARASKFVHKLGDFLTSDRKTAELFGFVDRIAKTDVNVLIRGETGTGKELVARYVHAHSRRSRGPYVPINCGAISREMAPSTFFGYVRGAFTGADPKGRRGLFDAARDGTLFLDEIAELALDIQAALLRVLEDGSYQRLGTDKESWTNCRVIAASNRDLSVEVERGTFRRDLYYRLNTVHLSIPPLRERKSDITYLAEHYLNLMCSKHALDPIKLSGDARDAMERCDWPGNVRQLRNAIEAAVLCARGELSINDLPPDIVDGSQAEDISNEIDFIDGLEGGNGMRDYERRVILAALTKYRKVNRVAKELGVSRSTLYRKFDALGIDYRKYL